MPARDSKGRFVKGSGGGGGVRDIDKGYAKVMAALSKNGKISVGIHDEEAGEAYDGGITVGEVATIHEFGIGVPERSFLRSYVDANEQRIREILKRIGEQVVKGNTTTEEGLEQAGLKFVGDIQERISAGIPPPNAPSTVARKGSDTPLIDTGQLRSSITHKVIPWK